MRIKLLGYIINILKPYSFYLIGFFLVALVWAAANVLMPYYLKLIIDGAVTHHTTHAMVFAALMYLVIWSIASLDLRLLDWLKLKLFPSVQEKIINQNFSYLNRHSYKYFQNHFPGNLVNKINDLELGIIDILNLVNDMFAEVLSLIIATVSLFLIHPVFAATLLGWVALFLFISFYFMKSVQNLSVICASAKSSLIGKLIDSVSNNINTRLFSQYQFENQYINHQTHQAFNKDRNMQFEIIKMRVLWDLSIVIFLGLNLGMLIKLYSSHLVTIGDFSFIISLSVNILWNLWYIAGQFVNFSKQIGKCKQALEIINVAHEIKDIPHAKRLKVKQGKIVFHQVQFNYGYRKQLFDNKNLTIEPGHKVGLVGRSGSGKSTFVNLILRLYDLKSGRILIDNQNIAKVTQDSLHKQIALIPQDISLFHRSILENIRYAKPNASQEEIIEASKRAHCHEFIMRLPEQYQAMVGDRGVKLSGGQRQRIAIARAFLKNAPILILDEATSALDSLTEHYIQESLHELMNGKTVIVIAHRLSTLAEMDRILVFEKGRIIEDGDHPQLLELNGQYAKMWQMQAGVFLNLDI